MALNLISKSENETIKFAKRFAKKLRGGEVLLLLGDLGSGKTTFVKGLAQGLGIKEKITSPTFVLMRQYKIKNFPPKADAPRAQKFKIKNFVHLDAYRLKTGQDLLDIGLGDWLNQPDTVVAVEWGEKLKQLLPKKKIFEILFFHGKQKNQRQIEIKKRG